jgi:hypothetical protein
LDEAVMQSRIDAANARIDTLFSDGFLRKALKDYFIDLGGRTPESTQAFDHFERHLKLSSEDAEELFAVQYPDAGPHELEYRCIYNFTFFLIDLFNFQHVKEAWDPALIQVAEQFYRQHKEHLNFQYLLPESSQSKNFETLALNTRMPKEIKIVLIQLGMDLNANRNSFGNTPLLFLISNAYNESAKLIIDWGRQYQKGIVDLDTLSPVFGTSAIHLIVAKGYRDKDNENNDINISNLELLENLLKAGANINNQTQVTNLYKTLGGNTALHIACARHDRDFILFLLKNGASDTIKNDKGETPFDMLHLSRTEARCFIAELTGAQSNFNTIYDPELDLTKITQLLQETSAAVTDDALTQHRARVAAMNAVVKNVEEQHPFPGTGLS